MKTYGTLRFGELTLPRGGKQGMWEIAAEPYVMVRVKRLFGRVQPHRSGSVLIADTPDVARDIEWLCERHPLDMTGAVRRWLTKRADAYRERETAVARILNGEQLHPGLQAPAREPRWYQTNASDMVMTTGALLITDPLGAGKTMTALLALRAPDALPAVVVTLSGKMPEQWCQEIELTLPWLTTHVAATGQPYDPTTRRGVDKQPDVLVMNYAKLAGWADHLAGQARTIVFDEVQELRHAGTNKYVGAAQIADQARYRIGLSNTPIYNYGGEAFNVIDVLSPGLLGTRDEFIREWCSVDGSGHVIVKDPPALRAYLRDLGIVLGRTDAELGIELPQTERIVHGVEANTEVLERLSGDAIEMAKLLIARDGNPWQRRQAAGELDWQMRQATGIAKAPFVAEYVRFLLETEEKVLLFGWHRAVYDIWIRRLGQFNPVLYTGSESTPQKKRTFKAFTEGDARILVMSLRSGAGIDGLQKHTRDVVFGELDWSPQVHNQAIGRLRRSGMDVSRPVRAHFLVAAEGSDPVIAQVQNLKKQQAVVFDTGPAQPFEAAPAEDRMRLLAAEVLRRAGHDLSASEVTG